MQGILLDCLFALGSSGGTGQIIIAQIERRILARREKTIRLTKD